MANKGYVLYKEVSFFAEGDKVRTDVRKFPHTTFKKAVEDLQYCTSFLSPIDGWDKNFVGNGAIATHRSENGYLDMAVTMMVISKGD